MITLTDGSLKITNFNNALRRHWPSLFLVLLTFRTAVAGMLLILGDSLSAGYYISISTTWSALLGDRQRTKTPVVNASISGDTSQQGLTCLPALLRQHQPRWVPIGPGDNDSLRGLAPVQTEQTPRIILQNVKVANAELLLTRIHLLIDCGCHYNETFNTICPEPAKEFDAPLLSFFMKEVYLKLRWMQDDDIHPNHNAQSFIAD